MRKAGRPGGMKLVFGREELEMADILKNNRFFFKNGVVENVEAHIDNTAEFCCKVVELLYKKGIFDKEDIKYLIKDLEIMDHYDIDEMEI